MDFIKTPVKGMPEKTPKQMVLREFALRKIKDTYKKYGFMLIETPLIEHIENLSNKQGGENEQLIFKILKRGEKLSEATSIDEMCDSGLRYDLTVPLSRFYANNMEQLPVPFKSLQIGESFRADRPQKGRFRQFTQCDIDILGENTNLAEIELISATVNMLQELNLKDLLVRVNDRKILRAMALACGFEEDKLDTIFIILDKMDKIGLCGVKQSLLDLGFNVNNVEKYCNFFNGDICTSYVNESLANNLKGNLSEDVVRNLNEIIEVSSKLVQAGCKIVFDPTLVRGMSYYTGPIFEIQLLSFNLSIAGGGRYDKMIGKYLGKEVSACGFSIGFERLFSLIEDNNLINIETQEAIAYLVPKNCDKDKKMQIISCANEQRAKGKIASVIIRNNNIKHQKEMLSNYGYTTFIDADDI